MSNCTQACMCSGWCFWTYFTAIANAIGASFVVGSNSIICPHFPGGKLQLHCLSSSTTLLPLRWICATPPSLSKATLFSKFFRGLCLNARSEPPCRARFFVKYFCPNECLKADADVSSSLIARLREYNKTTMQWP